MRKVFLAVWYDPDKVKARAKERGWIEEEGGMLDAYHPEEDPRGHEQLECPDLKSAETHLRNIVAEGKDIWGQAKIREFEVDGPRCQYCVCQGWKCVREYEVEAAGITGQSTHDECGDDLED